MTSPTFFKIMILCQTRIDIGGKQSIFFPTKKEEAISHGKGFMNNQKVGSELPNGQNSKYVWRFYCWLKNRIASAVFLFLCFYQYKSKPFLSKLSPIKQKLFGLFFFLPTQLSENQNSIKIGQSGTNDNFSQGQIGW